MQPKSNNCHIVAVDVYLPMCVIAARDTLKKNACVHRIQHLDPEKKSWFKVQKCNIYM